VDGGTIRLRGESGQKSDWKDYKTARLQGIYYGAFFQDNQSLIDWVNSQKLKLISLMMKNKKVNKLDFYSRKLLANNVLFIQKRDAPYNFAIFAVNTAYKTR
jgi:hypothetical protein